MARLRVGVLGLSHDHVWPNLAAIAGSDLGRLVAAADPDPRLRVREWLGTPRLMPAIVTARGAINAHHRQSHCGRVLVPDR